VADTAGEAQRSTIAFRSEVIVRALRGLLWFLFWAFIFALAYTQAPLYYSNQNQYFLHGLTQAGYGNLDRDWLANTTDPTPLFTWIVAFTYRYLHPYLFHFYYVLILGVYFRSMLSLFDVLTNDQASRPVRMCFIVLFVAAHAAVFRWLSMRWLGVDYPWYLQAGVANQYTLGFGLQPSVAGVFLIASVPVFLRGRRYAGAALVCLGTILHATYLPAAAFLIIAYMYICYRERNLQTALLLGTLALLLVSPVVIYTAVQFAPSSAEAQAEAQRLLAHVRIPGHADPRKWFDLIAGLQIAWIIVAVGLVRGHRLMPILAVVFVLSVLLTLVQVATTSDILALLFPWRSSVILVPLATTVILTRIVQSLVPMLDRRTNLQKVAIQIGCGAVIVTLATGGAIIMYRGLGYQSNPEEVNLLQYIKDNNQREDVYLLPVKLPALGSGSRGAASLNFAPPVRPSKDENIIPIDFQSFRLSTGAPIYVDAKAIPYKDGELLEWHARLKWCGELYGKEDWNQDKIADELRIRGITHIITTAKQNIRCDDLIKEYDDGRYRVWRVRGSGEQTVRGRV